MRAGPKQNMSVRPKEIEALSDSEDENGVEFPEEVRAEVGENICLEKEGEAVKKLFDPKLPSEEEVEKHWVMGHVPCRNWCPVCVRSSGKEMDHQIDKGKERVLPEYSWDYCFPGDELGFKWTVLVGKER